LTETYYEVMVSYSGNKSQNEEWFATDLQVYGRPKLCNFDISIGSNVALEITFDSGSNWIDLSKSNQLELKDDIHLMISPGELVNIRTTNGSDVTVQRCNIYSSS